LSCKLSLGSQLISYEVEAITLQTMLNISFKISMKRLSIAGMQISSNIGELIALLGKYNTVKINRNNDHICNRGFVLSVGDLQNQTQKAGNTTQGAINQNWHMFSFSEYTQFAVSLFNPLSSVTINL
jgi:hypothetical protein